MSAYCSIEATREQLAESCDFLEVAYLILNGELPNQQQKTEFEVTVTRHTMVHEEWRVLSGFSPRRASDGGYCAGWWAHSPRFITTPFVVVAIEFAAISWIRMRYMDTPFLQAAFQVVVGGVLVFAAGILIGSS